MKIRLRRIKYRSMRGRLGYLLICFAHAIDFLVIALTLGNLSIDLAETLMFCEWMQD
jgi:hypothetical protein